MRFDIELPELAPSNEFTYEVSVCINARRVPADEAEPYPMPEPELPAIDPFPAQPAEPAAPVDTLPLDPVAEPVVTEPAAPIAEPQPEPAAPVTEPVGELVPLVPFPSEPPLIDPVAPVAEVPVVDVPPEPVAEPAQPVEGIAVGEPAPEGGTLPVVAPDGAGIAPEPAPVAEVPAEPAPVVAEPAPVVEPAPVAEPPASSGGSIDAPDNGAVVPQPEPVAVVTPPESGPAESVLPGDAAPAVPAAAPVTPAVTPPAEGVAPLPAEAVDDNAVEVVAEVPGDPVAEPAAAGGWTTIGGEWDTLSVPEGSVVRFGSGDAWVQKEVSGQFVATNEFFGEDPAVGVTKQVELLAR